MAVWVVCFVCVGSWSFGVGIVLYLSCWIPDFLRKVMKFFEIFSQPSGLVGKLNQSVHWVRFSRTAVWVCFFVYIGSWSFVVRIALCLFCWILDFVRNVLTKFQNFSQSFGLFENRFNQLCKTAHGQPPGLECFSLESIMACS